MRLPPSARILPALLLAAQAWGARTRPLTSPPDVLTLRRPQGPEWFGLYLLGRKAGFTRSELRLELRDGARVLVSRQDAEVSAAVGPRTVRRVHRDEKVYRAEPRGRLLGFRSQRSGDGGERTVEGRCDLQSCSVTLSSAAGLERRNIPAPAETAEQADAQRLAAARRGTVSGSQLDLEQLLERRAESRFRGRRSVGAAGGQLEASLIVERAEGEREGSTVLVADDGRVLELRLGSSLVARAEPEALARRLEAVDLFGLTKVPLPRTLPTAVPMTVVYRLRGLPPGFPLDDQRQQAAMLPGGDVRLTVSAHSPVAALPGGDFPRAAAAVQRSGVVPPGVDAARPDEAGAGDADLLLPSSSWLGAIDSDAPALRALAAEVSGPERGSYATALRLSQLLHRRLAKVLGQGRDRASEVLAAGAGDCAEHSLLLTALARAAGVPARPVWGLVQATLAGQPSALYWHAWVEVKSGPEWIALDPTLGQPVADATHLALGHTASADLVSLLGGLRVISATPRRAR